MINILKLRLNYSDIIIFEFGNLHIGWLNKLATQILNV